MAYSADLRERVVGAYEAGEGSIRVIAKRFQVHKDTVSNWLRLSRDQGHIWPRKLLTSGPRNCRRSNRLS